MSKLLLATAPLLILLACQITERDQPSSVLNQEGESTEVPDHPSLIFSCPEGEQRVSQMFVTHQSLPEDFRTGLPAGLTLDPHPLEGKGVRLEACFSEEGGASLKRVSWVEYGAGSIHSFLPDSTVAELTDNSFRVGDISFGVKRFPLAQVTVENLEDALFGDPSRLHIEFRYRQFSREYRMNINGYPGQREPIVRFYRSYLQDNESEWRYTFFYAGLLDIGDPFAKGENGCTPGWDRKSHRWILGEEQLQLDLCWRDSGSPFAGFTRNYYAVRFQFDGHVAVDTEDHQEISQLLRLDVRHHNFTDCAVMTTPERKYVLSLRKSSIHACDLEGPPFERSHGFDGYRFAVEIDGDWRLAPAVVIEDPPFAPWPLDAPIEWPEPQFGL